MTGPAASSSAGFGARSKTGLEEISSQGILRLHLAAVYYLVEATRACHLIYLNGVPKWLANVLSNAGWRQAP